MNDSMTEREAKQTPVEHGPSVNGILTSPDIVVSKSFKNLPREKAIQVDRLVRRNMGKPLLSALGISMILSAGCGNTEYSNIPTTTEPTPASHTFILPDTSTPTAETTKTQKPPTPTSSPQVAQTPEATKIPTSAPMPETSIGLDTSRLEPTPISIKTQEVISYLEPKIIDGMETYGHQKPLTENELLKLFEKLNSLKQEMRDDTYYGTIFAQGNLYKFLQRIKMENDSYQKFLKDNEEAFNLMIHSQSYPDIGKLLLRRLIIVDDTIKPEHLPIYDNSIKDSDGGWLFRLPFNPNDPQNANAYFNPQGVNWGYLHEFGHSIFHLNDQYLLDFDSKDTLPSQIEKDIPSQWKSYFATKRSDIGHNLMASTEEHLGLYSSLQIMRRIKKGVAHDNEFLAMDLNYFPYEIPQSITFSLGKDYPNATVDIFRSNSKDPYNEDAIEQIGTHVVSEAGDLTLTKDKLFIQNDRNEWIDSGYGVLLLKFTTSEGKHFFRWMDIRDFNIPYWQGYENHVTMNFNLASEKDDPNSFDWRIKYSNGDTAP